MERQTYFFGEGRAEGTREMKELLGGKGANLAEMTNLGLPVPPGFTITTKVCTFYYQNDQTYPPQLTAEVEKALAKLEKAVGAKFGSAENPLLVSVRSGARVSMPGMMDTILNLGLNDETVKGLAKASANERFAFDSYRRFIQMFSDVVMHIQPHHFEHLLESYRSRANVQADSELSVGDLKKIVQQFKNIYLDEIGKPFPQDPKEQLWGAIGSVFQSWSSARAMSYRRIHGISDEWGTAVNIQAMVFGNMGEDSATGVAFTRDPANGQKRFFGEFLPNAQGEDVVAGIRTPLPINKDSDSHGNAAANMEMLFPKPYAELVELYKKLENHYRDMQDLEFTVQRGKLYLLQTRSGKRAASAAVRIAVDMANEGLITKEEAISRVKPEHIEQLLHPRLDPKAKKHVIAKGLPASPGAASGEAVFSSEQAEALKRQGKKVILIRHETSPEDISGMDAAVGILTALGGMTSHAAVVARGMGKPCVAGCGSISINYKNQEFSVSGQIVKRGDTLTIDGSTGEVILGHIDTINSQVDQYFTQLMQWVDSVRQLRVRANAETPNDAKVARQFGAEGIGLCRTEHMFFEPDRILAVREMILADSTSQRESALKKIFPMQREDFLEIYRAMEGLPVTIRLLDPPLHEFLPHSDEEIRQLSNELDVAPEVLVTKIQRLKEFNPMLGHRGCRLGISFPEIYRMQTQAILEAACLLITDEKLKVEPEIMVPFVGTLEEFVYVKNHILEVKEDVFQKYGINFPVRVGTMIEIPRAALVADRIAKEADFFSFGTNDLTQMTLGLSRDDSGSFLPEYVEKKIYEADPFVSVDRSGVGKLMELATTAGRQVNPNMKLGICGEHGGDPKTIDFCHGLALNYVSCSPFRVPVARLAAARAALSAR